jgi:predicted phage terminase large subunit-like protein
MSVAEWGEQGMRAAYGALGPLRLRYCPIMPTPRQEAFLRLQAPEVFFGGAAGPGKSFALLAAALQYADVPGYRALMLRKTYADLALPGALMDVAQSWLGGTDAHWNATTKTWSFPNDASLTFGYLQTELDKLRYQGAAFQFIGWDELTMFSESSYRFLFSRLRRPSEPAGGKTAPDGMSIDRVPLRMRSASNPGGPGHAWVHQMFVDPRTRSSTSRFLPARVIDNPHLDVEAYMRTLAFLSATERARLIRGDWDARESGGMFFRAWFPIVDQAPPGGRACRFWDCASTPPSDRAPDPDWTVGTLMRRYQSAGGDRYLVEHVRRLRGTPMEVETAIVRAAEADGRDVAVRIEREPGSAGKLWVASLRAKLAGYDVAGIPSSGDKATRAAPFASAAENREVDLLAGPWIANWLDELEPFPDVAHDDQVDSASGAFGVLTGRGSMRVASLAGSGARAEVRPR